MPIPTLAADAELITRTYLAGVAEVAAIVGTDDRGQPRVYTVIPTAGGQLAPPDGAFLRLRRLPSPPRKLYRPEFDAAAMQLDAYGGSKRTANRLIETARAALSVMHLAAHTGAIVSAVEFGPMGYIPDPDLLTSSSNARERFVADVTVVLRPARS